MTKSNLGKRFEQMIEAANKHYLYNSLAAIEKQEIKTRMVNGQMIYERKGPPDYMGIVQGGRAIAFEAKSTRGKNLPLKNITRRMHQLGFLKKHEEMGGIAFYLVHFEDMGETYLLPIEEIEDAIRTAERGGRKSIPYEAFLYPVKSTWHTNLDYMGAYEELEKDRYTEQPAAVKKRI